VQFQEENETKNNENYAAQSVNYRTIRISWHESHNWDEWTIEIYAKPLYSKRKWLIQTRLKGGETNCRHERVVKQLANSTGLTYIPCRYQLNCYCIQRRSVGINGDIKRSQEDITCSHTEDWRLTYRCFCSTVKIFLINYVYHPSVAANNVPFVVACGHKWWFQSKALYTCPGCAVHYTQLG